MTGPEAPPRNRTGLVLLVIALLAVVGAIANSCMNQDVPGPVSTGAPGRVPISAAAPQPSDAQTVDQSGGATTAAHLWFSATCPVPQGSWGPAVQAMMTPGAWVSVDHSAPVVHASWSCTDQQVASTLNPDGSVLVRFQAMRKITTPTGNWVVEKATAVRVLVYDDARQAWLVDRVPAE